MSRNSRVYLEDILEACARISRYTNGMTLETFLADEKTLDAVVRNLQIIGEAVKNLGPDVRELSPATDWKKIAGLRDIVVHQYFGVDGELIWTVVSSNLADLAKTVQRILDGTQTKRSPRLEPQ